MLNLTTDQGNAGQNNDSALLSLSGRHEQIRISHSGEMCGNWDSMHGGDGVDGCSHLACSPT